MSNTHTENIPQPNTPPPIGDFESNINKLHMADGACRVSGCSCSSFVVKDKHNAQFCENCGHARSQHVNG